MNQLQKILYQPEEPKTIREIITWWEKKRMYYNLIILILQFVWFVFEWKLNDNYGIGSYDFILFLGFAFFFNVGYCSGWLFEVIVRKSIYEFSFKNFSPLLFIIGTFTSAGLILFFIAMDVLSYFEPGILH